MRNIPLLLSVVWLSKRKYIWHVKKLAPVIPIVNCLQCFDTVGWAAVRASSQ